MAGALGSGIVCGIITWLFAILTRYNAEIFATWVCFVGITSYFAAGCGKQGFARSMSSNLAGVAIGCTIIFLSNGKGDVMGGVITGVFTWLICYLSHIDLTKFSFCTFMGGYSSFATGGNWKMLVVCLIIGNITGHICYMLGNFLYDKFGKKDVEEDWVVLKFFEGEE